MRPPASAFENRIQGAEKIGPSRYSDFFNKIPPKADIVRTILWRYAVLLVLGASTIIRDALIK
jgi:hypothetical protein